MKISTLLLITSVTFLSYWGYNKIYYNTESKLPELRIEVPDENNDENIFEDVEEKKEVNEPLTPLQKLVQDHFQIAHR